MSLVPSPSLKGGSREEVTATDKDEGPDTTLLQNVPLYAVPDKLRTKVTQNYIVCVVYEQIPLVEDKFFDLVLACSGVDICA